MEIEEEGLWAWFRLLDQAEIEPTPIPGRVIATFTVNNQKAIFELEYDSVIGAATINELDRFTCSFHFY